MSVNNVSALTDAIKYLNDVDVVEKETSLVSDVKESIFSPVNLVFGALEVGSGLKEATKTNTLKEAAGALKSANLADICISKNPVKQAGEAVSYFVSKADTKAAEAALKAAETSSKTGILAGIKKVFSGTKKGISTVISKIPGVKALGKSTFGKVLKGTGAVGIMALEGVVGLFTEVVPAFVQGGFKSGMVQLGKTATSVAGSGLGWAGGSIAGKAIGGTVGSIIGGIFGFGPVGATVGGAIGTFFGSIVGSVIGGGIARKITGKSESEKNQEKQYEEAAKEISQDAQAMNEINALVVQKVQEEIASGNVDEDTEKMAAYINSGALSVSTVDAQAQTTQLDSYNPSFTANDAIETAADNQAQTTMSPSYWNDLAQKIQEGDSSIYDISDDKLQSVFTTPAKTSSSSLNSGFLANSEEEKVNYFV